MSRQPATALASMTRGVLAWAERQGIDTTAVIGVADRERLARAGDGGRIPRELHVSIWTSIERVLADPAFGLKSASSILSASSLGLVGMLAMTSSTVGESLARSVKYSRILKDDVFARMHQHDDDVVVELWTREPQARAISDASLYAFLHFFEEWTGRSVTPRAVFFRHARPLDAHEYERFGCTVHFDHAVDAIVFDRSVCAVPLRTAQPAVGAYLETVGDLWMRDLAAAEGPLELRTRVVSAVRGALADGSSDIADVARRMGMSPRTLQRALGAQQLSYRRVLDEVRWTLAAPLVAATDIPLEEIAERMGYADGKAFRRAFRRWAGVAPIDARRDGRRSLLR
jgi:AraC-like DNA-binding protein